MQNDYHETIDTLFSLLRQANLADALQKQEWQATDDSCGSGDHYYAHIRKAIISIAGEEIVQQGAEFGEIDHSLANRSK